MCIEQVLNLMCQIIKAQDSLFPICSLRPWQSPLLWFPWSLTFVYFLFSAHVIRYIFGGFPGLLLIFSAVTAGGPWLAPPLQYALRWLQRPSTQLFPCAFLLEIWKQSPNRSVRTETGSENFEPNYSKINTFRKPTCRKFNQEGEGQPQ